MVHAIGACCGGLSCCWAWIRWGSAVDHGQGESVLAPAYPARLSLGLPGLRFWR